MAGTDNVTFEISFSDQLKKAVLGRKKKKVKAMKANFSVEFNELRAKSNNGTIFYEIVGERDSVEECIRQMQATVDKAQGELTVVRPEDETPLEMEAAPPQEDEILEDETQLQQIESTELTATETDEMETLSKDEEEVLLPAVVDDEKAKEPLPLPEDVAEPSLPESVEAEVQQPPPETIASPLTSSMNEEVPTTEEEPSLVVENENILHVSTAEDPNAVPQPPPPTSVAANANSKTFLREEPDVPPPAPESPEVAEEESAIVMDDEDLSYERVSATIEPDSNVIDQYFSEEADSTAPATKTTSTTTPATLSSMAFPATPEQETEEEAANGSLPSFVDNTPGSGMKVQSNLTSGQIVETSIEGSKMRSATVERMDAEETQQGGLGLISVAGIVVLAAAAVGLYYFRSSQKKGKK